MWKNFAAKVKLKAEVLRRKKILISNPDIQNMNDTQWLFELESIYSGEEKKYEDIMDMFKITKAGLISLLGLNVMPISEVVGEDDFGEKIVRLRSAGENEFLPLSMLCGSPEIISEVVKKLEELRTQDDVDQEIESGEMLDIDVLEQRLAEVNNPDIPEFFNSPEEMRLHMYKNNPLNKAILESMVSPLDTSKCELDGNTSNNVVNISKPRKKSKVVIE